MIIEQDPETRRAVAVTLTFRTQRIAATVRRRLRDVNILSSRQVRELRILIPAKSTAARVQTLVNTLFTPDHRNIP